MNTPFSVPEITENYTALVRILFTPSGVSTGERSGRGPSSPQNLAQQAQSLSPVSAQLTQALAAQLTNADSDVYFQTSVKLLAKALTDLEISAYLYKAALDEEEGISWSQTDVAERSLTNLGTIEEYLQVLVGEVEISLRVVERGGTDPQDIPTARVNLSETAADTLDGILERATKTGEMALGRLAGLGVAEIAQAVSFMGMGIAEVLGQAENLSSLYNSFRDFLNRAYESLIELIGTQFVQIAGEQVVEWLNTLKEGVSLNTILSDFYATQETSEYVDQLAANTQAELEKFIKTIQDVGELNTAYAIQIRWAEKILKALKWFGTLSTALLPQGELVIASLCIILGTHVILLGSDYVDSPKMAKLDKVAGVRRQVETSLATI
jgi:hypothetical protein